MEEKKKRATDLVNRYLDHCVSLDYELLLRKYPAKGVKMLPWEKNKLKVWFHQKNVSHLWKHFDVLEWWNDFGRTSFPDILPVAAVALAKPYTNAQQERDFSKASWFDGKLKQKQLPETLEMKVMSSLNRNVVEMMVKSSEFEENYPLQIEVFNKNIDIEDYDDDEIQVEEEDVIDLAHEDYMGKSLDDDYNQTNDAIDISE